MTTKMMFSPMPLGALLFVLLALCSQARAQPAPPSDESLVTQVRQLQAQVNALQTQLASLLEIAQYVSLQTVNEEPTVRFTGVNVQVVNGAGKTDSTNGTGNLIVGYDEPSQSLPRCTLGTNPSTGTPVTDQTTCENAGADWLISFKNGSHYLVLGRYNNYSRWGGLVAGQQNTSNYDFANVMGGAGNLASGPWSAVSGGYRNTASGSRSSVSGGGGGIASGSISSISGGSANTASAGWSSVSGGARNVASGNFSSVSGGGDTSGNPALGNTASGISSSVSGGSGNAASGNASSILGGQSQSTTSNYQTIPPLP